MDTGDFFKARDAYEKATQEAMAAIRKCEKIKKKKVSLNRKNAEREAGKAIFRALNASKRACRKVKKGLRNAQDAGSRDFWKAAQDDLDKIAEAYSKFYQEQWRKAGL